VNLWGLIPLISCLTFTTLFILVLQQVRRRVDKVFALFLFASGVWSFTSFMLVFNPSASSQYLIFWNGLVMTAIPWVVVSYYHFVRAYNNKPGGIGLYLGYAFVLIILVLCLSGYVVKSATLVNGFLYHDIKPWDYVIAGVLVPLLAFVMWMLVQRYRSSTDSADRNRTMYLMIGWSTVVVISYITPFTPALAGLTTDHVGNLINALIISYAISRFQLLDIKFVMRKGLVYSSLTIFLTALYLLLLFILQMFFHEWLGYTSLVLAASLALLIAVLFNPLRDFFQKWIDRIFYRETYDYRQMLLSFSDKVSNVLDLGELAQSILDPIIKAMHVKRAALLFPDIESSNFNTQFFQQTTKEEPPIKLRFTSDNPVVTWLATEGKALRRALIDIIPQFKGLWEAERVALMAPGVELLCPIRSKGNLIGILAVGEKQSGSPYSDEEVDLLMTMANEAAVAVENARMLNSLKKQELRVRQLLARAVHTQEEERKRISIDLHDSVAQWLVAASYRAQTCSHVLSGDDNDVARQELADMESTLNKSLKELRRVVTGLRPPALDELGLTHALRQSLEDLKADGLDCQFSQAGTPVRLPSSVEIAVYRVVQEALNNVRKHANATKVNLRLQFQEDKLLVEVRDNGIGFDLSQTLDSATSVGRMGLLGMKQRAETLGGAIKIKTGSGTGTSIIFSLPIQPQEEEK